MRSSIYLSIVFFLLSTLGFGQVSFKAIPETNQVLQGSYFTIDFVLNNEELKDFKAPDFNGFKVVAGPMQSSSIQIINGARSSEIKVSYSLVADEVGLKIIKPAIVQTKNSGTLKSLPLQIRISKRNQGSNANEKMVYAKMTISDSTAVVGQNLFLYYTLYHSVGQPVRDIELRREDKFSIFNAANVNSQDLKAKREIIDGKEYYVQVVAVRSLVPLEAGEYTISAAQLNTYYEGSRRSRFGFSRTNAVPVISNDLKINIENLPLQDKPETFCGAIGNYTLKSSVSKSRSKVDEAISLKLTISGDGDPKNLIAPRYQSTDSLEIYDPQLISEKSYVQQGKTLHFKLYEYLLVPKNEGIVSFQPNIYVYSTAEDSFKRLDATKHTIRVTPRNDNDIATTTEDLDLGIAPLINTISFNQKKTPFINSIWYLGFLLPLLLLTIFLSLYKYYLSKKPEVDYKKLSYDNAGNVALKQLAASKQHMDDNDSRAFYEELNHALLSYIANKLKIQTSSLNKNNLKSRLQQLEISTDTINGFLDIISNVEMSLFAGSQSSARLNDIYTKAIESIKEIENQINTTS